MLSTNALPVCFWQSRQWQACTIKGAAVNLYRTAPQAHPPSRSIATLLVRPCSYAFNTNLAVIAVICTARSASADRNTPEKLDLSVRFTIHYKQNYSFFWQP